MGTLSQVSLTSTDSDPSPHHHSESGSEPDLSQSLEYNVASEHLPSIQEIPVSPMATTPIRPSLKGRGHDSTTPESSNVILRHHKVSRRATLPAKFDQPEYLSPIHADRQRRPPSSELPGMLPLQHRY